MIIYHILSQFLDIYEKLFGSDLEKLFGSDLKKLH